MKSAPPHPALSPLGASNGVWGQEESCGFEDLQQEFAHDGGQRDFGGFARLAEALVGLAQPGVLHAGCGKWRVPTAAALGLEESAGCVPAVQDPAALLASKMPVEEVRAVLGHLTGIQQKKRLELTLEPHQMILQLDAWNIRERDAWGQSEARRRQGQEPQRWHWVYSGTGFRLDKVFGDGVRGLPGASSPDTIGPRPCPGTSW